jgi:hypothetical protein
MTDWADNPQATGIIPDGESWLYHCPSRRPGGLPCPTVTQGGKQGLDAHLRCVHRITLEAWKIAPRPAAELP